MSDFASIADAIDDIRVGKMVVVVDDENRENEGDVVLAAELITPDAINFMVTNARGWICLTLTPEHAGVLELSPMAAKNESSFETAFTVTIEARKGVTTGISAADRAHTIKVAANPTSTRADIVVPGHISPLIAKVGGVLERPGHTEASVDLARLAGLTPAGVICEIMNADGTMARLPDLQAYARLHNLKLISIADLITYRQANNL